MPYFSIIVSNYNRKIFLKSLFDNIFSQKFTDYEIIFVDNGSDDGSVEFVTSIKSEKIKLISCQIRGSAFTRNVGIMASNGKYIYFLDTDNRLASESSLFDLYTIVSTNDTQVFLFSNINYYGNLISKSNKINQNINLKYYLNMKGEFTILAESDWFKKNLHLEIFGSLNAFASYILFRPALQNNIFVSSYVSQIYNTFLSDRISTKKNNYNRCNSLYIYYSMVLKDFGFEIVKNNKKFLITVFIKYLYFSVLRNFLISKTYSVF
jgi:glycosyltransferase involved in cell wall biosynthesis